MLKRFRFISLAGLIVMLLSGPALALDSSASLDRSDDYVSVAGGSSTAGDWSTDPTLTSHTFESFPRGTHDGHDDSRYLETWSFESSRYVNFDPFSGQGPISISPAPGHSFAWGSGYAEAGDGQLGASARSLSNGNSMNTYSTTDARFSNQALVTGGDGGGLAELRLNLRLDGSMEVGDSDGFSYSFSQLIADYTISSDTPYFRNPGDETLYNDGFLSYDPYTLLEFTANGTIYGGGGSVYGSPYWEVDTSANVVRSGGNDVDEFGLSGPYSYTYNFDTGFLELNYNANIGSTLSIDARLSTTSSASDDSWAYTDFNNTLSSSTIALTDGVEITWAAAPTAAIPEPASMLLLSSGLLGVIGLRRRCK